MSPSPVTITVHRFPLKIRFYPFADSRLCLYKDGLPSILNTEILCTSAADSSGIPLLPSPASFSTRSQQSLSSFSFSLSSEPHTLSSFNFPFLLLLLPVTEVSGARSISQVCFYDSVKLYICVLFAK